MIRLSVCLALDRAIRLRDRYARSLVRAEFVRGFAKQTCCGTGAMEVLKLAICILPATRRIA